MSIFSWLWHVFIPPPHIVKLPHHQGRPVPPHRRPRRRRASCPSPSRSPAFLQPRSHGWLARCGAITAFQGVFWSVGGSIVRHERPRGQRTVPTARGRRQGNVKRSFTASTASRTPRPSNRRAAAKFSAGGVESWQKSRPASRHRVESGAAEQRCYKGAFAPGLGRLGRAHDERSLGFVGVGLLRWRCGGRTNARHEPREGGVLVCNGVFSRGPKHAAVAVLHLEHRAHRVVR